MMEWIYLVRTENVYKLYIFIEIELLRST